MIKLANLELPARCQKICPEHVADAAQLRAYQSRFIAEGFEGVMIRAPYSPYKCGRSTTSEGFLLKLKQWDDDEAEILEVVEELANLNPAEKDAFGRTKRSSCMENRHGRGTLGALRVRSLSSGAEFSIGSGFDQKTRDKLWAYRRRIVGAVVKYKHQPSGAKDAPRFPIFLGVPRAVGHGERSMRRRFLNWLWRPTTICGWCPTFGRPPRRLRRGGLFHRYLHPSHGMCAECEAQINSRRAARCVAPPRPFPPPPGN